MGKNMNVMRLSNTILNSTAIILLLVLSLSIVFGWTLSSSFLGITGLILSSYLILQSKIKNFKALIKHTSFNWRSLLHSISFGAGMFGLFGSIILIVLGKIPQMLGLIGGTFMALLILCILELIEDYV